MERIGLPACPSKPALEARELMSPAQASDLMDLFKVLASDTRLRLLHALARSGGMCVSDLASAVGMKPQAVSNQLQRLADRGVVVANRRSNYVHYRIADPCALSLLDLGLCLIEETRRPSMSAQESDSRKASIT